MSERNARDKEAQRGKKTGQKNTQQCSAEHRSAEEFNRNHLQTFALLDMFSSRGKLSSEDLKQRHSLSVFTV